MSILDRIYYGLADVGRTVAFTGIFGAAVLGGHVPSYVYSAEPPAKIEPDKLSIDELVSRAEKNCEQARNAKENQKELYGKVLEDSVKVAKLIKGGKEKPSPEDMPSFYFACKLQAEALYSLKKYDQELSVLDELINLMEGKGKDKLSGEDLSLLADAYMPKGDAFRKLKNYKGAVEAFKTAFELLQKRLNAEKEYEGRKYDGESLVYVKSRWIEAKYFGELVPMYKELHKLKKGTPEAEAKAKEALEKCDEILKIGEGSDDRLLKSVELIKKTAKDILGK